MLLKTRSLTIAAIMVLGLATTGCSNGGSGASVDNISGLPSADVSNYDYSLSTSTSTTQFTTGLRTAKKFAKGPGEEGGFSRAGCETGQMKNHVFKAGTTVEAMKCRIAAMVDADLFKEPSATAQTYKLGINDGGNEAKTIYFRMVKESKDGSDIMRLNMCQNEESTPSQSEEMLFGVNAEGKFTITMRHRQKQTVEDDSAHGRPGGTFSDQVAITGTADEASDGDADFSADFASKFTQTGQPAADGHKGRIKFTKSSASKTNELQGIFADKFMGNNNTFSVAAKWDESKGGAKFKGTGTFPAFPCPTFTGSPFSGSDYCCWDQDAKVIYSKTASKCDTGSSCASLTGDSSGTYVCPFTHEDSEAFSISTTKKDDSEVSTYTVVADSAVSWLADLALTYGDLTSVPETTFAWDYEWDCKADTEVTSAQFESKEGLKAALMVCEEIQQKGFAEDGFRDCHDAEADAQAGVK